MTSLYPTADRPEAGAFVARRVEALRGAGVEVEVVAASTYRHGPWRRHAHMLRAALTARGPVDGVEGHVLLPASLIAWLVARIRRVPLVVYAHGSDVAVAAQRTPAHRWLARLVARGADRVVTNSADTAEHIAALGVRALVIPPGVDLERFRPRDRQTARSALDLPVEGLIALYVGSLDRRKGADLFAAALDLAPGWRGIMLGAGPLADSLTGLSSVRLVPPVSRNEVRDWMAAADIVVVPSRREPLGLAAVEALACGVPVIAARVGGLAEVVRDGETGILVPPDDPSAIARALAIMADTTTRARFAAHAPASVQAHDLRTTTAAMSEVWRSLGVPA